MGPPTVRIRVAEPLRFLLTHRHRHRHGDVTVSVDGVSTVGHLVESLGVPRTEVGELRGVPSPQVIPAPGTVVDILPVRRPQRIDAPRFLLDVHLGTLARRLRLLGIDTAYRNDAGDEELVTAALTERRVLLTQDRGILRRRALPVGAYVRGSAPDDQLRDVLDRFRPPLHPWRRCLACNGDLAAVSRQDVDHLLEPGTRRSYTRFVRCGTCGRAYWRGAHAGRLDAVVADALATYGEPAGPRTGP